MAFQRLDRDRDDFVTAEDIMLFLHDNRIYDVAPLEARYLVDYFDADEDHRLAFTDFMQITIPCENEVLRCRCTQAQPFRVQ